MPFANWKGASVGMIVSHIVILFITFGHLTANRSVQFLETSIDGCTNETFSSSIVKPTSPMFISLARHKPIEVSRWVEQDITSTTQSPPPQDFSDFPQNVFAISYMYYSLFGTFITVFVGMAVSLLTRSEHDKYNSKYIHPVVYRFSKWFPGSEDLFSNEQEESTTNLKNTSLKDPKEQHFNGAFDISSEEIKSNINAYTSENEVSSIKFKTNLIVDICPVENYKKLSEDSTSS